MCPSVPFFDVFSLPIAFYKYIIIICPPKQYLPSLTGAHPSSVPTTLYTIYRTRLVPWLHDTQIYVYCTLSDLGGFSSFTRNPMRVGTKIDCPVYTWDTFDGGPSITTFTECLKFLKGIIIIIYLGHVLFVGVLNISFESTVFFYDDDRIVSVSHIVLLYTPTCCLYFIFTFLEARNRSVHHHRSSMEMVVRYAGIYNRYPGPYIYIFGRNYTRRIPADDKIDEVFSLSFFFDKHEYVFRLRVSRKFLFCGDAFGFYG